MKIENDLCRSCFGSGKWRGELCGDCNGTGIRATHQRAGFVALCVSALIVVAIIAYVAGV